ncbi:ribosome maturation factor RimM [Dehalococcoidia bacterium]|nr:ribosome maturation factor RimM [Dehalococcoidia bacterium]
MTDNNPKDLVEIGIIKKPFGLKGELKFFQHSPTIGNILSVSEIWINSKIEKLEYVKEHQKDIILKILSVNSKEEASKLSNLSIEIEEKFLIPLPDGKFYHSDLIDSLVTSSKKTIGTLKEIIETGGNEVYVISLNEDKKELLVPNTPTFINFFDKEKKVIDIVIPEVF